MEFSGRIEKVMPLMKGVSQKTGNEWQIQRFVFEYFENPTDRYSDKVVLETFDTNIIAQLEEGLPVRIGFGHKIREVNDKNGNKMLVNELRLYKFTVEGRVIGTEAPGTQNTNQMEQSPTAQPQNAPAGANLQNTESNGTNDLPF